MKKTEENFLLLRKHYFSKEISTSTLGNTNSVFDDENYDVDNKSEQKHDMAQDNAEGNPYFWQVQLKPLAFMLIFTLCRVSVFLF